MKLQNWLSCGVLALTAGCSFAARSPDMYRDDTRKVLETRGSQIQSCYDEVLKTDRTAKGSVVVHFSVVEETGVITAPEVLPESTAPAPLSQCVVKALDGLVLDPPDQRKGDATFAWEFNASG
jgi:hypothetical protein